MSDNGTLATEHSANGASHFNAPRQFYDAEISAQVNGTAELVCYLPSAKESPTVRAVYDDATVADVPHKKVCIVGRAPSSLHYVPYDDPSWEIVSLSNAAAMGEIKRWNRWYELHPLESGLKRWPKGFAEWLAKDHGKPLYIDELSPHAPFGTVFPWDKITQRFGRYFNNSISLMIANEILLGATDLSVCGVDMAQFDQSLHNGNGEYQHQRPSCEHMLGVAVGMGIDVFIPVESDLLKCHKLYAHEGNDNALARKNIARRDELTKRQQGLEVDLYDSRERLRQCEALCGKWEGILEILSELKAQSPDDKALDERIARMQQKQANAYGNVKALRLQVKNFEDARAKFEGALEDNHFWLTKVQM